MALLTVTINDPSLDTRASEVGFIRRALLEIEKEIGRGRGNVTSGTILAYTTGLGPTAMGSWTYLPSASNP